MSICEIRRFSKYDRQDFFPFLAVLLLVFEVWKVIYAKHLICFILTSKIFYNLIILCYLSIKSQSDFYFFLMFNFNYCN
jgi:hypothetical protein